MLTPFPAREGDLLTCTPGSVADADGDPVSFGFAWRIEGAAAPLAATAMVGIPITSPKTMHPYAQ